MSSPPRYHSELPAIPTDSYRSRTPATSLPPGAMEPGVPGGPPPVPTRINVDNYHDQRQTSYRAPPPLPKPPTTAPAMNEFGANYPSPSSTHLSAHSSVRRPLPSQPPNGPPSYSPPSYPQPSASGPASLGRRSLPKPPSASQSSTPLPPPRPSARTLPAVPPTASYNQTSTGYTAPPPVSPLPSRPQAGARTFDSAPLALPNDPVVGGDRLNETERVRYDSPANITPVESGSHPSAGPSRAPSQSYSLYTSSVNTHDTTSTAPYSDQSTETTATSIPSQDSGYAAFRSLYDPDSKLDEPDEGGTNVTLRPPSRAHLGVSEHASEDGRRTPTLANWTDDLEPPNLANLHIERRPRTTSQTTIGAVDAGLPSTPTSAPHRMLHHQRSLLDESSSSSAPRDVYFPVPHLSVPHSAADGSSSSQQSMYSNRSTPYGSDVSLPIHSQRSSPASFPEAGQSAPRRQSSQASSMRPSIASSDRRISAALSPSWQAIAQPPSSWVQTKLQIHQSHVDGEEYYDDDGSLRRDSAYEDDIINEYGEEEDEDVEEVNEIRFFQPSFLSEAALQLRDRVQRSRQMKAGIAWVGSFTGRDIVNTIQSFLPDYTRDSPNDRRAALVMAQSLQNQLWFVEVDWDIKPLRDSSEDVFRFMSEMEGMGEGLTSELPSGLMTMATKCYSPSCTGDRRCYAARCPFKTSPDTFLGQKQVAVPRPAPTTSMSRGDWTQNVEPMILRNMSEAQYTRQTIIRNAIESEVQYEADLTAMERLYIQGLREANPPIISPPRRLEQFIAEVFYNERELHDICRRLIEHFTVRERESPQSPLIMSVGDIFLTAAADFRMTYPDYTGNLPQAENLIKKETEENPDFRFFCDRIVRENDRRRDIKYLISRPSTQLQRYPAVLDAILNSTDPNDPDRDFLVEALSSIQNLSAMSQLKHFHASKGRGPAGKLEWHDLVPEEQRKSMDKKEQKRQMQIWELIKGEMEYVADLETIDTLFVNGLRVAERGIVIERTRLEIFLDDAFHNYRSLLEVHQRLLENLQYRQLEQHPRFGMISDLLLDAALNWQEAYMEYVTHYPIAKAKVQEEEARNPKFAAFLKECLRDPASNRQDIYHFINRPIPRLLRYNLLLSDILKSLKESGVADNHPDIETIPQVMEIIGDLGKATQKGVAVNEAKVELWQYHHSLDGGRYGPRVVKDLDLLNPMRELIHRGKVFRQPEGTIGTSWTELYVLLFDHYAVLVKPEKQSRSSRREEKQVKYIINRRPIPLELLSIGNFSDAPRARTKTRILGGSSHEPGETSGEVQDSKIVWPFTISFIGQGQLGGQYTLWCDSYASRAEWHDKLQHAKVLRNEVNDANKVFDMTPLSLDTFFMPPNYGMPSKGDADSAFTGRVTCSVPFTTVDRRLLVAVGCEEGVWIGLRHDPRSLRKVLHVKAVTNIAVLEEFGIFLVLQDKSLLAYHLEALVPSAQSPQVRAAPQRLSPGKDIVFFTVGQLSGRTLVLYMKRKGMDSLFRVLEPILGRNTEDVSRQRRPFGNLLGQRTEWFRLYKDFFIPTEALGVHFLKHKLAVVCSKGFEIMDLTDLKGGSIPIFDPAKVRDKPKLAEIQRRCESSKPLGMFRSTETEFLLCYDSFGVYVDRHGEPNRDCQVIEWEGRPDSVAFHPPYLLLCSAPFMEIRHIDNAKLLQIYTGSDIRLTWDGTGGQARPPIDNPGPNGYGDEASSQEPRIHICQRPDDTRRGRQGIGQHVFELTPTLALNNPLLNPVHTHDSNYFPPAPLMASMTNVTSPPRTSSIMTASTSEGYYANPALNMTMSNGTTNEAQAVYGNGYAIPSRSDVSWDSTGGQQQQYRQGGGW